MAGRSQAYSARVRKIVGVAGKWLTRSHADFLAVYDFNRNAATAAKLAGLDLDAEPDVAASYVYFLLCPGRKTVLYVGKGKGSRRFHHAAEIRRGVVGSVKKYTALRALAKNGQEPVAVVFRCGLTDDDARRLERALILWFGTKNLLNTQTGSVPPHERGLAEIRKMIQRVEASPASSEWQSTWKARILSEMRQVEREMLDGTFADVIRVKYSPEGKLLSIRHYYKGREVPVPWKQPEEHDEVD